MTDDEKQLLGGVGWLSFCDPAFRDGFLEIGSLKHLEKGTSLYEDGQKATHVYGLINGQIDVHLTAEKGEVLIYPFTAPGRWYGLADVVSGLPAFGTAVAGSSSRTLCISKKEIIDFLEAQPSRYQYIVAHEFSLRRLVQETVLDLVTSDGLELVSRRLLRMMKFEAVDLSSGFQISQIDFATAAGVSVPTVQRAFRELRHIGAIETSYGKIVVKDLGKLEKFVENFSV